MKKIVSEIKGCLCEELMAVGFHTMDYVNH
jgi:hypothetical protein